MNEKDMLKSELNNNPFGIRHALRGLGIFFLGRNTKIQFGIFVIVIIMGIYFSVSKIEWLFILLAASLVFMTEALNTAIEINTDLTSPDYHPYARDTKDVAAGAVLVAVIFAIIVGLAIFLPKVI